MVHNAMPTPNIKSAIRLIPHPMDRSNPSLSAKTADAAIVNPIINNISGMAVFLPIIRIIVP
jgi:hypothetical protein